LRDKIGREDIQAYLEEKHSTEKIKAICKKNSAIHFYNIVLEAYTVKLTLATHNMVGKIAALKQDLLVWPKHCLE
jgi:hypothetical protein